MSILRIFPRTYCVASTQYKFNSTATPKVILDNKSYFVAKKQTREKRRNIADFLMNPCIKN